MSLMAKKAFEKLLDLRVLALFSCLYKRKDMIFL